MKPLNVLYRMPEVSVIIPNYNHAPYLDRRIESILSQTYQDFEVIILDDCSTDNSEEVLEKYKAHLKVSHIIYNSINSGSTFEQWKKGIAIARGNFIWIAESDDWCEPSLLQELVLPMIDDPSTAISFCQTILVTPEEKILSLTHTAFLSQRLEGTSFVQTHMLGMNYIINASAVVFRKSSFENVLVPYNEMKYCGDWLLWASLCLQGSVFISGKYLNYYFRHKNSVAPLAIRKGYSFLEGNKIFHFILSQVKVSHVNKLKGLKLRAKMYYERKPLFLNEEINRNVLNAMYELDPRMKSIMRRERWIHRTRGLIRKVKSFLRSANARSNWKESPSN